MPNWLRSPPIPFDLSRRVALAAFERLYRKPRRCCPIVVRLDLSGNEKPSQGVSSQATTVTERLVSPSTSWPVVHFVAGVAECPRSRLPVRGRPYQACPPRPPFRSQLLFQPTIPARALAYRITDSDWIPALLPLRSLVNSFRK